MTSKLVEHQTVTIYKNSDYRQEVPYLDFKRMRPLSTRYSSPEEGEGMFLKGKSENSWSKTFEQLEVVRSAL